MRVLLSEELHPGPEAGQVPTHVRHGGQVLPDVLALMLHGQCLGLVALRLLIKAEADVLRDVA
eukprot:CAMPEP_0180785818 /NCGR_PEP_ID=MMETSP1038_2-20121128/50429_1 /TAXON_ID=632150 /ORGANISM="Azadinium spinosum, Strain 3D9" /LENGTH=62 /DNA_ID=CAMNT_0022822817 /DNA_START=97 /DNA_END=281 /DNA_ORIENTATION=+